MFRNLWVTGVLSLSFGCSLQPQLQFEDISESKVENESPELTSCQEVEPRYDSVSARAEVSCTLTSEGGTCDDFINLPSGGTATGAPTKKVSPGWAPGDRICIPGGNYPFAWLWIENVTGAEGNPIELINCDGQVVIGNSIDSNSDGRVDDSRGIEFRNSKFVKLTGSGSRDHRYGIKLAGTENGPGLSFGSLSSDMEAEFLEITKSAFAGIMAKTEPNCTDTNPTSFRGGFVQRNSVFHDNYIHDLIGGEGFYIGYSFFQGNTPGNCGGATIYSHTVLDTKVYNNRLENIPCEAIQIGYGENSEVYNNYIHGYGQDPFAAWQNNGIQIGLGTSGKFYNNYVASSPADTALGSAFTIMNYKDTLVYGNTLVGAGIYVNLRSGQNWDGTPGPYTLTIANNTILNHEQSTVNRGIWSFNSVIGLEFFNNLILLADPLSGTPESHVAIDAIYDQTNNGSNITQAGNRAGLVSADAATTFLDYSGNDFRLLPDSGAVNTGADVSALGLNVSMALNHTTKRVLSCPRLQGGAIDVGAFEVQTPAGQAP